MTREDVEKHLDLNDQEIKFLYGGWDKGDCSLIGLIRILMIQEIRKEIATRGDQYDGVYDRIKLALYKEYFT